MNPPAPRAALGVFDFAGVGIYLIVTFSVVVWSSRRQTTTEDFFLGGRRMPWMAVGLSLLATLLSTISYLAVPGEVIKNGITMFAGYMAIPFSMLVVLTLWVPFFMRLRLTSAYEYLELRFGYTARLLAGLLFLLLRLGWMSLVMYAASLAMSEMIRTSLPVQLVDPVAAWLRGPEPLGGAGPPMMRDTFVYWVVGTIGVLSIAYTYLGGMRAVIWNDVLQFLMLFGGAFLVVGYVALATGSGPLDWWEAITATHARHTRPLLFSTDITVRMTVVTAVLHSFFWTICTHGSDQVVLQRYFSTTSLASARKSYIVNAISDVSIGILLALSGLALLYFYQAHPSYLPKGMSTGTTADKLLPYFFAHQLPAGLGGMILAAFVCDAMQTLVSGVNSITAVTTQDLFERLFPRRRWLSDLALARLVTLMVGSVVTVLAFAVTYGATHSGRNLVDLMPRSFNMFLGPLASLFLIGMFLPKCTSRTAVPAVLCGLCLSVVWSYWLEIPALLNWIGFESLATAWPGILGTDLQGRACVLWDSGLAGAWPQILLKETPKSPTIMLAIGLPCVSSFLLAAVAGLVFDRGRQHHGRDFTWWAVMRRKVPVEQPKG